MQHLLRIFVLIIQSIFVIGVWTFTILFYGCDISFDVQTCPFMFLFFFAFHVGLEENVFQFFHLSSTSENQNTNDDYMIISCFFNVYDHVLIPLQAYHLSRVYHNFMITPCFAPCFLTCDEHFRSVHIRLRRTHHQPSVLSTVSSLVVVGILNQIDSITQNVRIKR